MQYGHFDNGKREYIIDRVDLPVSWTNYIGTGDMMGVFNHTAGGYLVYKSSEYHRVTRFRANGVPMDSPGHYLYLRDDADGDYWSVSWQPVGKPREHFSCRHGLGYVKYHSDYSGIDAEQTLFVAMDDPVEIWDLRLRNDSAKPRTLSVFSYVEFSFHHVAMDNQNFQMSLYAAGSRFVDGVIEHDLYYEQDGYQFFTSGILGLILCIYALTMPNCPCKPKTAESQSLMDSLGLSAFKLFKEGQFAVFFIFSMLLGASLQITNGYANTYISSFADIPEYANTWGARNANALISISQMSETLCILLIPFFMKKFGIKKVMLIAMFAWVFRFGFFGLGNPGGGVWLFILSCLVYGVAFDFFNISGSLYVNENTDKGIRSSAQGLFMLMTNGLGASIGTWVAGKVVNACVYNAANPSWQKAWYIFAAYALVVGVLFAIFFKDPQKKEKTA